MRPATDNLGIMMLNLPLRSASSLRRSRVDVSPTDVRPHNLRARLIREDELRVALGGIARTCVSAVHPVHEVAIAVPDGEDEDRTPLESAALGI